MPIEKQLQEALHYTTEGITLTDPHKEDNPLIYVNDAFCKMTGYTSEEVIGKNCRFLQGEKTDQKTVQAVSRSLRENRSEVFEIFNYRKNGEGFWNRLSLAPIFKGDKLWCYVGIQSDISHHMQTLELINTHHKSLLKMMQIVSGDMRTKLREMLKDFGAQEEAREKAKYVLQQLTILITMIENDSSEILSQVRLGKERV